MKKDAIIAELTQHPVGHGGLFFGTVRCGKRKFCWIYDCGSRGKIVNREIDKIAKHRKINTLYLSHLHNDHISGIDYLLSRCDVEQFVIPYINGYDSIFNLLHNFELYIGGHISKEKFEIIKELIMDPEEFCSKRNIKRLIRVVEQRIEAIDDDDEDIAEPEEDDSKTEDTDVLTDVWRSEGERISPENDGSSSAVDVYVVPGNAVGSLSISSHFFDWEFIPHVHPMPDNGEEFRRSVNEFLKKSPEHKLSEEEIKNIASSQSKLKELVKFYGGTTKLNSLSMSLYVGPKFTDIRKDDNVHGNFGCIRGETTIRHNNNLCKFIYPYHYFCYFPYHYPHHFFLLYKEHKIGASRYYYRVERYNGGWILTGDSNFTDSDHLECFINRYKKFEPYIDIVMVPHHGSIKNVDQNFFDFFNNPVVTYVTAKPGDKHPDPVVKDMANELAPFHVVSRDETSGITLRSKWWVYS